ncbi:MAG: hypothetical protein AVDCRST_MAG89-228, partial [uncultured Gemmatimonadetes bacterium]
HAEAPDHRQRDGSDEPGVVPDARGSDRL